MEQLVALGLFLILVIIGVFAGGAAERAHLRSLDTRERKLKSRMQVTNLKRFPKNVDPSKTPELIVGEVVVAADYFKIFAAGLRSLVGGEVRSLQTLVSRAEREATLRVLEEAHRKGFDAICCLRLNTANIGGQTPMVEMNASATAFKRLKQG